MTLRTHEILLNVFIALILAAMLLSTLVAWLAVAGIPSGYSEGFLIRIAACVGVPAAVAVFPFMCYADWICLRRKSACSEKLAL